MRNKFILLWNDAPIGLNFEGYPFKPPDPPNGVKFFYTREEAESYNRHWPNLNMEVVEVEFLIVRGQ